MTEVAAPAAPVAAPQATERVTALAPAVARPLSAARQGRLLWIKLASVLVTLVLWEVLGRDISPIFFSTPLKILAAIPDMILSGELPRAALTSIGPFIVGWGSAIVLGVTVGLLMGRYKVIEALLDAQMTALYSAPTVALVPVFVLWLGLGFSAKVAIIFLSAFFPITINAMGGARSVSPDVIDIGRVERAREDQIFLKVVLPASMPFILTGVRASIGRAVVGMVVAEMFTAISGLGGSIVLYGSNYKMDRLFVTVIVLSLMGVLLTEVMKLLERRLMPWRA